jgi:two-component system, NarL family, nitrate/nitrite sensor histidine kinase NarX
LLRIIQEALSNVRKHARATHIHIGVRSSGDDIQTVVQDNGKGFDPALVDGRAGKVGLRFMEERATEVHGSVRIKSELGKGTDVTILVPRRENHEGTTR